MSFVECEFQTVLHHASKFRKGSYIFHSFRFSIDLAYIVWVCLHTKLLFALGEYALMLLFKHCLLTKARMQSAWLETSLQAKFALLC